MPDSVFHDLSTFGLVEMLRRSKFAFNLALKCPLEGQLFLRQQTDICRNPNCLASCLTSLYNEAHQVIIVPPGKNAFCIVVYMFLLCVKMLAVLKMCDGKEKVGSAS